MIANGRALLASISATLRPQARSLAEALVAQNIELMPELGGDQTMINLLISSMVDNLETGLTVLETGVNEVPAVAPPAALEHARRLAQRGVPLSSLLRAYRLGQAGFQQLAIQEMFTLTVDPEIIVGASLELSTTTFGYVDDIAEQVVAAYQAERDRWTRNGATVRAARVRSVLAEGALDISNAEDSLGYILRQRHLGVVLWADETSQRAGRQPRLERLLGRLCERIGTDGELPLTVAADESTLWAWIPAPVGAPERVDPEWETPVADGLWIATGQSESGVEGFRLTHRQAHAAQAVVLAIPTRQRARVTAWAEVGLLALMTPDMAALRGWVLRTLGDLAVDDEHHAQLRETLQVLLLERGSFTAAARNLGLHKNTIQYRITRATEILGRDWRDGRLDLEVALRASQVFGHAVLHQPTRRL